MKCNEAEVLIMEYFDGGLKKEKLDILLEHFKECEACELEFNALREVIDAVEALPELEPAPSFTKNVMISVEQKSWKLRSERYLSSFMWAAALFAFMILTRDFFTTSINGLANTAAFSSTGMNASLVTLMGNIFSDLPGKFSALLEQVFYIRTILLSEYLPFVIGVLLTFILANLGLGKMILGNEPNRRPV